MRAVSAQASMHNYASQSTARPVEPGIVGPQTMPRLLAPRAPSCRSAPTYYSSVQDARDLADLRACGSSGGRPLVATRQGHSLAAGLPVPRARRRRHAGGIETSRPGLACPERPRDGLAGRHSGDTGGGAGQAPSAARAVSAWSMVAGGCAARPGGPAARPGGGVPAPGCTGYRPGRTGGSDDHAR